MINTHSKFYFDYVVTADNQSLDFDEGGGEIQANVAVGSYTLTEMLDAVATAMNDAGANTYAVSVNRATRIITIESEGEEIFELSVATGTRVGSSVWAAIGFTGADRTGANTYSGNLAAGKEYVTQFMLQGYIPTEHKIGASDGVVNKAASGRVEVFRFGEERFMKCEIKWVTDAVMPDGHPIRNDQSGVSKLQVFMAYLITKGPLEFMPDEDTVATFETLILDATEKDKNGIAFELKELYAKGLPGVYETGALTFRKLS